jgi:hypothetical protein
MIVPPIGAIRELEADNLWILVGRFVSDELLPANPLALNFSPGSTE